MDLLHSMRNLKPVYHRTQALLIIALVVISFTVLTFVLRNIVSISDPGMLSLWTWTSCSVWGFP